MSALTQKAAYNEQDQTRTITSMHDESLSITLEGIDSDIAPLALKQVRDFEHAAYKKACNDAREMLGIEGRL